MVGCITKNYLISENGFLISRDGFPISENGFPTGIKRDDGAIIRLGMSREEVEEVLGFVELRPEDISSFGHLGQVGLYYDGYGRIVISYSDDNHVLAIFIHGSENWAIAGGIRPGINPTNSFVQYELMLVRRTNSDLRYVDRNQRGRIIYTMNIRFNQIDHLEADIAVISIMDEPRFRGFEIR